MIFKGKYLLPEITATFSVGVKLPDFKLVKPRISLTYLVKD